MGYGSSGNTIKGSQNKPKKKANQTILTKRQQDALQRHKQHHTAKHMTEMRKLMRQGKTFTQSHNIVLKKIGK